MLKRQLIVNAAQFIYILLVHAALTHSFIRRYNIAKLKDGNKKILTVNGDGSLKKQLSLFLVNKLYLKLK